MVNVWVTLTYTFPIDYFLFKDKIRCVGFNNTLRSKMHGCDCTEGGSPAKELYCWVLYASQQALEVRRLSSWSAQDSKPRSSTGPRLFAGGGLCLQFVRRRIKTKQPLTSVKQNRVKHNTMRCICIWRGMLVKGNVVKFPMHILGPRAELKW